MKAQYGRIVLKLSGEVLAGENGFGIDPPVIDALAEEPTRAVIATGGTGIAPRDVTPETLAALYDREIPGFGELFRMISYQIIGTSTVQSRATAGVARGTYLFALPGSTGACKDAWDNILRDQLDIRHKPCNFAELLPRLREHEGDVAE